MRLFRRDRPPPPAPLYFLYLSDSKVDMLAPQVPTSLRSKIAAELKVDLKVLALTLKENPSAENQYARTRMVIDYLRAAGLIGTVEAPLDYFSGTLAVRWGPWAQDQDMVYFTGVLGDVTVGLGGSMSHVIGGRPQGSSAYRNASGYPLIASALQAGGFETYISRRSVEMQVAYEILQASKKMQGPLEEVTFVAKTFLVENVNLSDAYGSPLPLAGPVLLGSPIYVSAGSQEL